MINKGKFRKGNSPWNKGLTIEDPRVKKYVEGMTRTRRKLFKEGKLKCKRKINLDESKVVDMYLGKKMSSYKIAKVFGCCGTKIVEVLKKNNIKFFKPGFFLKGKEGNNKKVLDKKEIKRLYLDERKSSYEIGKIMNCSDVHILNYLKKMNIPRRNPSESRLGLKHKNPYTEEQRKARSERVKNEYKKYPNLRKIRSKQFKENIKKYKKEGRYDKIKEKQANSLRERYKSGRIKLWNKDKTHSDDSRILSGEKVHTFNNWSSFEPYTKEFNKKLKKLVRERDGCCMLCNISFEDLKLLKRRGSCHHINYYKLCNLLPNLVTLCSSCHSKTNFNRPHWTKFFQSLLSEKYDYKYSETGEIILNINKNE